MCHKSHPETDRLKAKQLRMCLLSKRVVILRQKSKGDAASAGPSGSQATRAPSGDGGAASVGPPRAAGYGKDGLIGRRRISLAPSVGVAPGPQCRYGSLWVLWFWFACMSS